MKKFISLSDFKDLYDSHSELLTDEGLSSFISKLRSGEGKSIARNNGYWDDEIDRFISLLSNQESIVFFGWVEQSKDLLQFLKSGKTEVAFVDQHKHLEHRWSESFKQFISPFLAPRILGSQRESQLELAVSFSYVGLLDNEHRALVEAELFKKIDDQLKRFKETEVSSEQELINAVKPLCTSEMIDSINCLSKASYASKLDFVDTVLSAIRSKGCTVRFANWILKQMERVQLNDEHQYKINDLRKELREGSLQVQNHGEGQTPIKWKNIAAIIFVLCLIGSVGYIIMYKPFSQVEDPNFQTSSSFKKFTVEERKTIDSLIKTMETDHLDEQIEVDPGLGISTTDQISLRKMFPSRLMEQINSDIHRDIRLKENYPKDSCKQTTRYVPYPGVKNLLKKKGTINTVFRNESDYDVIIYVCSSTSDNDVYATYVKQSETVEFKLDLLEIITTVAGNQFSSYQSPKIKPEEEAPSNAFKHHFCDTDANYFESLNSPMIMKRNSNKKAKFMVMGDKNGYYRVIDIYSHTEPYQ